MIEEGLILQERFELVKPIGTGGFGQVWEGTDNLNQSKCAIKFVTITK
jgi:serine/threonine protein kinase